MAAGGWINGVERSLIYCIRHKMGGDSATPDHDTPVFHPILLQRWKEHFAKEFPTLDSSKAVQKQVGIMLMLTAWSCTSVIASATAANIGLMSIL